MIKIKFKNVGQGDSILLEWEQDSIIKYGIIDCALYNSKNPLLEEIKTKQIREFEFIILSHLHYDHYSGLGDLFQYCINNSISVKIFLHTFTSEYLHLLDLKEMTREEERKTNLFLHYFDEANKSDIIKEIDDVSNNFTPIILNHNTNLFFLSPHGEDYFEVAQQRSRHKNEISSTYPDLNKLSTIIEISNKENSVLLTSDAPIKSFNRIIGKISNPLVLVQAPHHGSKRNLQVKFWDSLSKINQCPVLFSVGDVKRDSLPDVEVVSYFDKDFFVRSTNFVYGLPEYYNNSAPKPTSHLKPQIQKTSLSLNPFSKIKGLPITGASTRFMGDQIFTVL